MKRFSGRAWLRRSELLEACVVRSFGAAVRVLRPLAAGVVAVVGVATIAGLLDRVWWVFEPADVFRLQYLVVLVAAGMLALMLRRQRLAVVAAALAAVNFAVLGMPLTPHLTAASSARALGSMRLLAANVEVGNTNFAAVRRLVTATDPDLFEVTELTPVMAQHLGEELRAYGTRVVDARDDAYGIGVYSRLPLLSSKVVHFPADGPPTVVARVRVAGKAVTVVVTHVHTPFAGSIHTRHLHALAAAARSRLGRRVIVCGDFNSPPWSGPLRDFAGDARLHDVYGSHAWAGYSWPTWGYVLRVPIDNCFLSKGLAFTGHHDGPNIGSDHRPLVVDVGVLNR
jgi:endonuclease/exonuclease/phosphatase (EEP) superfamily protein YafD